MSFKSRFALYTMSGLPKSYFLVEAEDASPTVMTSVRQPGHFIFVCDASGSMYSQMEALRSLVVKLLTLEEYRDANMLVSILSFSSAGDLVTHASRVQIGDFMSPGSKALADVQRLSTRGMTCISQGLKAVRTLVKDELTAVVLLSDGFANDASPGAERREIDHLVIELAKLDRVFVNTISLGSWADFKLLAYIANACSGSCFQAPTAKEVYDILHETTSLISGSTAPAMKVDPQGSSFTVFVSKSGRKVLGSDKDILVRGLRSEDDRTIYRYRQVSAAEFEASTAPICGDAGVAIGPVLAFASAKLAEGAVTAAKQAMVAVRDETLLSVHARALVNSEIAAMSSAIESALLDGIPSDHIITPVYGIPNASVLSVLSVLGIIDSFASDVEVNIDALRAGYKKRGVRRVAGERNPDGSLKLPWIKTVPRDSSPWVSMSSFDINRNNATCNMLINRPVNLVKADDGSVISEVADIPLNVSSFNNYTIVGDGVLNVNQIVVRVKNKRLHRALTATNVLPDEAYDPKASYTIDLTGRPLVAYDATFDPKMLDGVFERAARLKILSSILNATMKGQSDSYTPEQLVELKRHYLTGKLNFSTPTTTEYTDLKAAIADGSVDTRLSYKVDFGVPAIPNLNELYSANAYLARRFTVTYGGVEDKKPKFDGRWSNNVKYEIKPVSAKMALGAVDDIMYPIFLDFLGLVENGEVVRILEDAGMSPSGALIVENALRGLVADKNAVVEILVDAGRVVDAALDGIFRDTVSPLVFYIGASGGIPDDFNVRALTAEQVREKFPRSDLGKDAGETTYYLLNDTLLSVYVKAEHFSTGAPQSEVE